MFWSPVTRFWPCPSHSGSINCRLSFGTQPIYMYTPPKEKKPPSQVNESGGRPNSIKTDKRSKDSGPAC